MTGSVTHTLSENEYLQMLLGNWRLSRTPARLNRPKKKHIKGNMGIKERLITIDEPSACAVEVGLEATLNPERNRM